MMVRKLLPGRAQMKEHEVEFRVRYQETDGQGRVHHANYLTFFEMGRTELMRAAGMDYRDMEREGLFLVVAKAELRYHADARFDDLLTLTTRVVRMKGATVEHEYRVCRDGELIVEGHTRLGCIDRDGKVRRLPAWLTGESDGRAEG